MIDIINYVSSSGWAMKFFPHPNKIEVELQTVEKQIDFRETLIIKDTSICDAELNVSLWGLINRMEERIENKIAGYIKTNANLIAKTHFNTETGEFSK